jgi:hypothetical protein
VSCVCMEVFIYMCVCLSACVCTPIQKEVSVDPEALMSEPTDNEPSSGMTVGERAYVHARVCMRVYECRCARPCLSFL